MNYDATSLVSGKMVSVNALPEKEKIDIMGLLSTYVDSLSTRGYAVHGNQSLNKEGIFESSKFSGFVNGAAMDFKLFVNPYSLQKGSRVSSIYVVTEGPGAPIGGAQEFFSNVEKTTDEVLEGLVREYYVQSGFAEVPDFNNDFHISCMGLELGENDPLRDIFAGPEDKNVLESLDDNDSVKTGLHDLASVIGTSNDNIQWRGGNIGGTIKGDFLYGANDLERRGAFFSDIGSSKDLAGLTKLYLSGLF